MTVPASDDFTEAADPSTPGWILATYRTPATPSTARVAAWRGLRELGGLFLGPTTCLLPAALADDGRLAEVEDRVIQASGAFERYGIAAFAPEAENRCRARYNAARDAEYAEVAVEAGRVVRRLQGEASRGYEAVEAREVDLVKLRARLRRVRRRDLFGASGRLAASAAVERATAVFEAFSAEATPGVGPIAEEVLGIDDLLGDLEPLVSSASGSAAG